ncbi:MAG: response regulator transcription factor [Ardenticatenaceae bacterium]|nr:response regulator transcription factor [Ardenticatenaceae bacterium]HBY97999.1 DNA-binding response regulator [Chloroflexota bacterium]
MAQTIHIYLADDHAVLRDGLRALLDAEPDMEVIGEASDGFGCIRDVTTLRPDVILLDLNMPQCNGLEALEELRRVAPESRVLVLTMHDDAGYLRQVLASGGAGYVLKNVASEELLSAIRAVYQGGTFLHPSHTKLLLDEIVDKHRAASTGSHGTLERYHSLSERETQIFKLVALGHRNSEIAGMLHLSVKTVETYKSRLMQKLDLRSRAALVRCALELGLLEHEDG